MEKIEKVKNDLPTAPAVSNGLMAGTTPADFQEVKAALAKIQGAKIKHAGGALPPLFPEKGIREGDCRLVTYLGAEIVPAERAGGSNPFVVLNFEVHDHTKPSLPIAWRAQMPLTATLEKYFQASEVGGLEDKDAKRLGLLNKAKLLEAAGEDEEFVAPTRDPETTPMLLITYAGQMAAKKQGFSGAKRWIVEEFSTSKN